MKKTASEIENEKNSLTNRKRCLQVFQGQDKSPYKWSDIQIWGASVELTERGLCNSVPIRIRWSIPNGGN